MDSTDYLRCSTGTTVKNYVKCVYRKARHHNVHTVDFSFSNLMKRVCTVITFCKVRQIYNDTGNRNSPGFVLRNTEVGSN